MGNTESFQDFAYVLGAEVINNKITIPGQKGIGSIQQMQVSSGLQLTFWDIFLNEPLELIKIAALPGSQRVFTLTYIFTNGDFLLQSSSAQNEIKLKGEANLLFDLGNQDTAFTLLPNIETRALVISMKTKWLEEEFDDLSMALSGLIDDLIENKKPFIYYQ